MPSLIQGRIVYARISVPDPQGRNPKANRPFVIITHFDDIQGAATIQGVAITDELSQTPEEDYYLLPTGSGRQSHGCSPGSAALCAWIENLKPEDLDISDGCLKPKVVYSIIEKVRKLRPAVFKSRAPSEPKAQP